MVHCDNEVASGGNIGAGYSREQPDVPAEMHSYSLLLPLITCH